MKSYRRPTSCRPMWICTLMFLAFAVLSGGGAYAAPQYTFSCDTCHRMPPLDSATGTRDPQTGAVKGSHQGHASAAASSCAKCHGSAVLTYKTGHRNGVIDFASNINGSPAGASYSRGFVNQTSVPPSILGSCSSVNCHFESTTPTWGSPVLAAPTDCGVCHGAAPNDGNHPVMGQKHGVYFGTGTAACIKCHPDHTSDAKPFSHATSAGNRGLIVQFTTAPNNGGSYSRDLSYPNYLPSKSAAADRKGSCSALYCHSPGNKTSGFDAPNNTPTWGGTLTCTGCHKADSVSGDPMQSGSHAKHVDGYVSTFACAKCHAATATAGMTIANVANHVNGQVNIVFSSSSTAVNGTYNGSLSPIAKTPGTAYGTCANVYCHSNVQNDGGVGITYRTPTWGTSATGKCGSCHDDGASHGGAASMATGSHKKHLSYQLLTNDNAARCAICHNVAGATFTPNAGCSQMSCHQNGALAKTHADHTINLSIVSYFGGVYDGNPTPGSGYGGCSMVYCHSNGQANPTYAPTVTWGSGALACNACHGSATSAGGGGTTTQLSGKHLSHVNNPGFHGAGNSLHCIECHRGTVADDNTIANTTNHVNHFVDYTGLRAGGPSDYDKTAKVCSNVYCHSSGQATPVYRNMTGSKSWGGTAKLACNSCHGYGPGAFTPVSGEPNYTNGGVGSGTENSHQKHTVGSNMTDSRGCAKCHRLTADKSVAGKLRDYSSAHVNGNRDIAFLPLGNYTGHYAADTKTCSNTYCHAGNSMQWGTPGPLACNSCHKADATLPGAHNKHWQSTLTYPTSYTDKPGNSGDAGNYRFQCATCHNGSHASGPAPNGNGSSAEVYFNYSALGRSGTYTYGATKTADGTLQWSNGSCATTYCHSDGNGGKPNVDSTGFNWSSGNVLGCTGCHGNNAASGTPMTSGKHSAHINPSLNGSLNAGNGLGCVECHAKTVSNDTTIGNKRNHVNRFKDFSGAKASSRGFDASAKTCSNIYCHSNGKTNALAFVNMTGSKGWNGSLSGIGCNGCHGRSTINGAPDYANGYPNDPNTANSHAKHIDTFTSMGVPNDTTLCARCHAATVDSVVPNRFRAYSTQHLNGSISVRFQAAYGPNGSYNSSTHVCSNVVCHSNGRGGYGSPVWGQSSNCALCHPLNTLSRGHSFHIYTSASNTPTVYKNFTANRSGLVAGAQRYNFGCSNCHPIVNANHASGTVLLDFVPGAANVVGSIKAKNSPAITVGSVPAGTPNSGTVVPAAGQLRCANIYCHSNGMTGASFKAYTTPDWFAGKFQGDRCSGCHGNSPNTGGKIGSPTHTAHVISIHNDDIFSGTTGVIAPAGPAGTLAGHGDPQQATTINCNVCHNLTVTTSGNDNNSICSSCHGATKQYGAASHGAASIASKSFHVNGRVDISFQNTAVISKAQIRDDSFSNTTTLTNTWTRNGGYKAGTGSFDRAKQALSNSSWGGGGNCSNISCHNGRPVNWYTNAGAQCTLCHSNL